MVGCQAFVPGQAARVQRIVEVQEADKRESARESERARARGRGREKERGGGTESVLADRCETTVMGVAG